MVFRIFPKNIFTISCCCTHQRFSSHLTDFPQAFSCTFDTFSLSAATLQKFSNFSNLISVIFVSIFVACLFAIVCLCFFTCFSLSLHDVVCQSFAWVAIVFFPLFFLAFPYFFITCLFACVVIVVVVALRSLSNVRQFICTISLQTFSLLWLRNVYGRGFSYYILINNLANDFIIINQ